MKILLLSIVIIIILFLLFNNTYDLFNNTKIENFKPSIVRYQNCTSDNNNCEKPLTNNKKNTFCNNNVSTFQYANRKILTPDNYLDYIIRPLLEDLSTVKDKNTLNKIINVPTESLKELNFNKDASNITNFLNYKINELVKTKKYLQQNGSWKYEYFTTSDPQIYYYQVSVLESASSSVPEKYNLLKVIFTLGNPLRSSYTNCLAFITEIDNKMTIVYTDLVNNQKSNNGLSNNNYNNLNYIDNLDFSFYDTIANNNFNKFGQPTDTSGIDNIWENRGKPIVIKPDIPDEFKQDKIPIQHLPPAFGAGVSQYPPIYEMPDNSKRFISSPPIMKE